MSTTTLITAAERGLLPDRVIRYGIRRLLAARLAAQRHRDPETQERERQELMRSLWSGPIAVATDTANDQHYELPAEFFAQILGPHMKYSSGLWMEGVHDLTSAEQAMLRLTVEHAEISDGMAVLDLGCGWGSLSLWLARSQPSSRIVAVSNSQRQAAHIAQRCRVEGLDNLEVITADMRDFIPGRRFDRIVSVEMFEHMRNWQALFSRIATWLEPDGRFFLHVFSHDSVPYLYEDQGATDWMARNFFTGGLMPSHDLPRAVPSDLEVRQQWRVNGDHYSRTLEAWLERLDERRRHLLPLLEQVYGDHGRLWLQRWRIFFMACSELFSYRDGHEWGVSHYLMAPTRQVAEQVEREEPAA